MITIMYTVSSTAFVENFSVIVLGEECCSRSLRETYYKVVSLIKEKISDLLVF